MTAYQTFWKAANDGDLIPIAFPIICNGRKGLGGGGVPYLENEQVLNYALSPDPRDRAAMAVMAIDYGMTQLIASNAARVPLKE